MLVPSYLAVQRLYLYITNPESQLRTENLIVVGYMATFSLVLTIPYLVACLMLKKGIPKQTLVLTSTPFIVMFFSVIIGTYMGIPW